MGGRRIAALMGLGAALAVAACGPRYRDIGEAPADAVPGLSDVFYKVHDGYLADPPACVAILPFVAAPGGASTREDISIDQAETVRRAFYAHLSPQGKRDVEPARIDFVLAQRERGLSPIETPLGEALNCDALISGQVLEYGSAFLGVYSRVAVGADVKMIRAADGAVLWEGRHHAESHGGAIPLSPVGLAMGILDAAANLQEETLLRVIDDLSRRLVGTIPDNRIAVLEDPVAAKPPGAALTASPDGAATFVAGLARQPDEARKAELARAIAQNRFGGEGQATLYDALIALDPENAGTQAEFAEHLMTRGDYGGALNRTDAALALDPADAAPIHFLRGRALLKLDRIADAEASIIKAVALDESNADYLNGLGYLNSSRGDDARALAAYRMAIAAKPDNGFAYYNMGVTLYNLGDKTNAADSFYGAGLAYLKSGHYGQAQKALADLRQLVAEGVAAQDAVGTLSGAIDDLSNNGG